MTTLSMEVSTLLASGSILTQAFANFRERSAQIEMAQAVAETIGQGGCLVVEAGTGIGKTFAYLLPALLSGRRVLISTATKNLQEQLVHRDLPRLLDALAKSHALHRRVALLKGRANYLCLHRLDQAWQDFPTRPDLVDTAPAGKLESIRLWAQSTRSGDVMEIGALEPDAALLAQITSTRENCLGSQCPRYDACHVYRARRAALAADVTVLNHHLFFAEFAHQQLGGTASDLLDRAQVMIFDEAHSLIEIGQQALGAQLSSSALRALAHDVQDIGTAQAAGWREWAELSQGVLRAEQQVQQALALLPSGTRAAWDDLLPEGVSPAQWTLALAALTQAIRAVLTELDALTDVAPDLARLHAQAVECLQTLMLLEGDDGGGEFESAFARVRSLSVSSDGWSIAQTPLLIAGPMSQLWDQVLPKAEDTSAWEDDSEEVAAHEKADEQAEPRAFVFTSATLGSEDTLAWFTAPMGLQAARVLRLVSPFNFAQMAGLYVPTEVLPEPSDPGHSAALAHWLADAIQLLGGRTLVLTTSLRAMNIIADLLAQRFQGSDGISVLVQGRASRAAIAQQFLEAGNTDDSACVLVASQSYWQGFDVPGDVIQMVVIDKLPFPVPTDPLVLAQERLLEQQGRKAFKEFALPEAAMALKQGAGRLIRTESDRGVLVVGDSRLLSKGYGKWLLRQLPPMRRLANQQEFEDLLRGLALTPITRTSTMDHPSHGNRS